MQTLRLSIDIESVGSSQGFIIVHEQSNPEYPQKDSKTQKSEQKFAD